MLIHLSFYSFHTEIRLVIQNTAGKYLPLMRVRANERDVFLLPSFYYCVLTWCYCWIHHWMNLFHQDIFRKTLEEGQTSPAEILKLSKVILSEIIDRLSQLDFNEWFSQHEHLLWQTFFILMLASPTLFNLCVFRVYPALFVLWFWIICHVILKIFSKMTCR